jgi:T5SS/PEP-CTERM-associated repeat protein
VAPDATIAAALNTPSFSALSSGAVTQSTGWTLHTLSTEVGRDAIDEYGFSLAVGTEFEATLTWAAHDDNTIDDLGLFLYHSDGVLIASSASTSGNVQQIDISPDVGGSYVLEVQLRGSVVGTVSDTYALAFAVTHLDRTLTWTGDGGSTSFGEATNWNDDTGGSMSAQTPPNPTDTVEFNSSGGAVTGTGTVAAMNVGSAGSGVLEVSAGATLVTGSLDAGVIASAVGQIGIVGPRTMLTVTGVATIADQGTGVLSVLSGATFVATSLTVGAQTGSSGVLVVSGSGSVVNLSGALNVGTSLGTGDLTVGPGAAVHASVVNLQGQVVLEGGLLDPTVSVINQGQTVGGFGTLAAADIVDEGMIQVGGSNSSQKLLLVQGTVLGGGTVTESGTLVPSESVGVLQINAGGTMELTGPVLNAATTTIFDALTPTGIYSVTNSVIDVSFADASGVLLLDDIGDFAGTVTSFRAGDQFVITGGTLANPGVSNGHTLTFSDIGANAGTGILDRIIFGSEITSGQFAIVNSNTVQIACFAKGTRIATEMGPAAVEDLAVGDLVLTADGREERIVWIGSRAIDCSNQPRPAAVWPVRLAAGAFGPNVPERDLYLSPDHAVFVDGVLVPVKLLINGANIVQVQRRAMIYFHVALPRHEVILAEGLAVESYLDLSDRAEFREGTRSVRPFPGPTARSARGVAEMWETCGAAPLVMAGPALAASRMAAEARAAADGRQGARGHGSHRPGSPRPPESGPVRCAPANGCRHFAGLP